MARDYTIPGNRCPQSIPMFWWARFESEIWSEHCSQKQSYCIVQHEYVILCASV